MESTLWPSSLWEWKAAPATDQLGWYAVVFVYDENEGLFPSSALWTGREWNDKRPIAAFHGPFETNDAAATWAYDHDPEDAGVKGDKPHPEVEP